MLRMKHGSVMAVVLTIGGFADRNLKDKYARMNFAADQWLQAKSAPQASMWRGRGRYGIRLGRHPLRANRFFREWGDGKLLRLSFEGLGSSSP